MDSSRHRDCHYGDVAYSLENAQGAGVQVLHELKVITECKQAGARDGCQEEQRSAGLSCEVESKHMSLIYVADYDAVSFMCRMIRCSSQ